MQNKQTVVTEMVFEKGTVICGEWPIDSGGSEYVNCAGTAVEVNPNLVSQHSPFADSSRYKPARPLSIQMQAKH